MKLKSNNLIFFQNEDNLELYTSTVTSVVQWLKHLESNCDILGSKPSNSSNKMKTFVKTRLGCKVFSIAKHLSTLESH